MSALAHPKIVFEVAVGLLPRGAGARDAVTIVSEETLESEIRPEARGRGDLDSEAMVYFGVVGQHVGREEGRSGARQVSR